MHLHPFPSLSSTTLYHLSIPILPCYLQPQTPSELQLITLDPADVGVPKKEKVWGSADEAIKDLKSGSLVLSAGFGLCGVPQTLINAIRSNEKIQDLTVVSNNAGNSGNGGLSPLVKSGQISTMILSYVGTNKSLQEAYLAGQVTLELSPQGTIAERLRAGGAGIPAVITPTGAGTFVETGGIPRRLSLKNESEGAKQTVLLEGKKKKVMEFEGKRFLLEPAIKGDVAIIRAHKVDKAGNCVFRYTTKAFAGLMARAAKLTIVEAEQIVEIGQIPPEEVDLPGIYVDRIVPATAEKQIEITVLKEEPPSSSDGPQKKDPARIRRELIARRAAKELKDGFYCNLGVGMPVLAASYLAPGTNVWLQSENGILGMGPYPTAEQVDADIINAGKETVTLLLGASVFDSVESFTMIRGGHVDVSILGAMQVSADGDLANFMIPNKLVKGMGGAMDLVSNPDETMVIVVTDHTDKNGRSKILQKCTLPLTGVRVASKIITDLCVFEVDRKRGGLTLTELARGVTVEDVRSKTDATFALADKIGTYE
ncbi:hypothetical protein HD553DRAFT_309213 [Filobasidium floriforme]|uniref:uncharacterized protein n=1 Tax=Filobasidium floriforme TaxID=5210 RepID=UPI001E8D9408|nr:uncharacterized protein HD553DRAFT_309213 [Filobasidium floriforme]KAH8087108.1 hypothetical protein HD553DRAFT_309213 [Filobasidium floriforme]